MSMHQVKPVCSYLLFSVILGRYIKDMVMHTPAPKDR